VSGGFALPITFDLAEGDDLSRGVAPPVWAEAAFPLSSRVSLHSGIDWVTPYEREWRRGTRVTGIGTYREIVLSQAVGFRVPSSWWTEVTALAGFGFVFVRRAEVAEIVSGGIGPSETSRTNETKFYPSVLGGLNASIALNRQVSMIVRLRVRATQRGPGIQDQFGWLSITPSVGFRFALGAR
jgi:hypothetical protein